MAVTVKAGEKAISRPVTAGNPEQPAPAKTEAPAPEEKKTRSRKKTAEE